MAGVRMLEEARKSPGAPELVEATALSMLRTEYFVNRLDRCFQLPSSIRGQAQERVLNILLGDDISDLQDNPQLAPFFRAGIVDSYGEFSCIASRWYYNRRRFPNRATETPPSLDDLVIRAVQSISTTRLKATLQDSFPKKAPFQHLFNEALSLHLPLKNYIVPELSTFTTRTVDGSDQFGELDFYIKGDLQ